MKKDQIVKLKEDLMALHVYCHNIEAIALEQLGNVSRYDEVCLSELRKELRKALLEVDFIIETQNADEKKPVIEN